MGPCLTKSLLHMPALQKQRLHPSMLASQICCDLLTQIKVARTASGSLTLLPLHEPLWYLSTHNAHTLIVPPNLRLSQMQSCLLNHALSYALLKPSDVSAYLEEPSAGDSEDGSLAIYS